MPINGTCVQTTYAFKLVCDLSIGAISDDLERKYEINPVFKVRPFFDTKYSLSQTATDTAIVTGE